MKAKHLLLISVTAALPMLAVMAEDTGKTDSANQQTTSETNGSAAGNDQKMCNQHQTQTELDKLVAEMNSAPADKKLDAVVAVVAKLVEEFKATQQQTETKTAAGGKSSTKMCDMMMGMNMKDNGDNQNGDSSHQH
jgi:hypothetical protein